MDPPPVVNICSIAYLQVKNMPRPSIAMTSSQSSVCALIAGVLPPRSHRFRPGAPAAAANSCRSPVGPLWASTFAATATWRAEVCGSAWFALVTSSAASAPTRSYAAAIGSISGLAAEPSCLAGYAAATLGFWQRLQCRVTRPLGAIRYPKRCRPSRQRRLKPNRGEPSLDANRAVVSGMPW